MKNCITTCLLLLAVSFVTPLYAQNCCTGGDWPALAMNTDFGAAHLPPEPIDYTPDERSRMMTFNTLDAEKPCRAFYVPSDAQATGVLLIFHEWWGLNEYIMQEAEKWQKLLGSVDVYAVDLYDGVVATDAKTAAQLSSNLDEKRAETIVKSVLMQAGKDKRVATLGWCMGGSWSFKATMLAGNNATGCVMFYGFPEKEEKNIRNLQTDVLYVWASKDSFITKNDVAEFKNAVEATQHEFYWHTYEAGHAFANPSNPKHDKLAAAQADHEALKFLKEKFQIE